MILLTGSDGFIGRSLCTELNFRGITVRPLVRSATVTSPAALTVGDIGPATDWTAVLPGVDCVVHTVARVHVMQDKAVDPLTAFRLVNVSGTLNLARQAVAAGVRRFVFLSSIKVHGEQTGAPPMPTRRSRSAPAPHEGRDLFCVGDMPAPQDAYALSKWEAEQGLLALARESGMEVVIIRPPLVYGPGVKANFLSMLQYLYRGIPLPFGAINNQRSLVAMDNLVDLIITCTNHPAAANQTFLVADGEDLSTTNLLKRLGQALGKPARLFPVPVWLLEAGAAALGRRGMAQRLCCSLRVDISGTREILGWSPPVTVDSGLQKTADAFLADRRIDGGL